MVCSIEAKTGQHGEESFGIGKAVVKLQVATDCLTRDMHARADQDRKVADESYLLHQTSEWMPERCNTLMECPKKSSILGSKIAIS